MDTLLNIRNLRVWFDVRIGFIAGLLGKEQKHVRAVDDVSFEVRRGEVFCLVGESGCGKTTTGKALLRLNDPTSGNIFFDMPERAWDDILAAEIRLKDLEAALPPNTRAEGTAAEATLNQICELEAQLQTARNPPGDAAREASRVELAASKAVFDEREQDLLRGTDPAVNRLLSGDRGRLELLEKWGTWLTPRRARKLEKARRGLKEARYRVVRAASQHMKTRKFDRRVRALERVIRKTESHKDATSPEAVARVRFARQALDVKAKHLTDLELARVRQERDRLRPAPAAAVMTAASTSATAIARIESRIGALRTRGGARVEALGLRAWLDAVTERYDLAQFSAKGSAATRRMRDLRRRMQIIYQDPYESLNPKLSIYDIVAEPLLANRVTSTQAEAQAAVAKSLEDVGLRPAQEYMFRYPHELSGGQRQRVGIATALVVDPDFIVADEPVSMLDASVRTEIIALLLDLKKRRNLTYLFITHDLGLAWIIADRIAVMYLGKIVETGNAPEIIQNPRHPYTKALISVVPSPNPSIHREKTILRGERPDPVDIPPGCRFHPRCPRAVGICGWDAEEVLPELQKLVKADAASASEASTVSEVTVTGLLSLALTASDPVRVQSYLKRRIQEVALKIPPLGAIRTMTPKSDRLEVTLHEPVEPPLRPIAGDILVACHTVVPATSSPEMAPPAVTVAA